MKRRPVKIPVVLTPEEQARLLERLPGDNALADHRDQALIAVMLNAGLRAAEVLALTDRDIEWTRGRLWVRQGKGRKDRSVWVGAKTLALLRSWLDCRPPHPALDNGNRPIFTTLDGSRPLGGRMLRYLVKDWAARAGITKPVHLHTLRHSFAANLLRQEGNVFTVMRALGHKNIATTQIYLSIEDSELEAAMKRLEIGG